MRLFSTGVVRHNCYTSSAKRSTCHTWGTSENGSQAMTMQFEHDRYFVQCNQQRTSFITVCHVQSFRSYRVDKQLINTQTSWFCRKHPRCSGMLRRWWRTTHTIGRLDSSTELHWELRAISRVLRSTVTRQCTECPTWDWRLCNGLSALMMMMMNELYCKKNNTVKR